MLHIRVLTAGAMVLMMAGAAAAQSDEVSGTAPAPGKPISLLQILLKPASSAPAQDDQAAPTANDQTQPVQRRTHRTVAHRHRWTRKYAHRRVHDDEDTATAPSPTPAPAQPAATETQAPDTNTPATSDQPNRGAMAVSSPTAQAASPSPDQVNMTDMTAGSMQPAMPLAITAAPQDGSAMQPSDGAAGQSAPEQEQPVTLDQNPETSQTVAMASTVQQDDGTDRSRDRWYKNLLAALSGAFVAASLAWIKIGLTPPRRNKELMLSYETENLRR